MKYIAWYIAILCIVFFSGIWGSIFFLPERYRKDKIIFSFLYGVMFLILFSAWLSYLGFTFENVAKIIFGTSVILSLVSIIKEYRSGNNKDWVLSLNQSIVLLLAFFSGIIVLTPVIIFNAIPSMDCFTYVSIADYLQNHSYFDSANPNPYSPWLTQMKIYQVYGFRMGTSFLLSFFSSLLWQKYSIILFMPLIGVAQFCLVSTMSIFSKILFDKERTVVFSSFLSAVHLVPLSYGIVGFLPQSYGVFLYVAIMIIFLDLKSWELNRIKISFTLSLLIATLIITYSELLPIVSLSIAAIILFCLIRERISFSYLFILFIPSIFLISIMSNVGLVKAISAIKFQLSAVVGANISYTFWDYLLQTFSLNPQFYMMKNFNYGFPIIYFFVSIFALFLVFIIFKEFLLNNKINIQKVSIAKVLSPIILSMIYFIFFAKNPFVSDTRGHTWSILKAFQYGVIFIVPVVSYSILAFTDRFRPRKVIIAVFIFIFTSLSISSTYLLAKDQTVQMSVMTGNASDPLGEYLKLAIYYLNETRPINIISTSPYLIKHRQMIAYFLRDHQLISHWKDDEYVGIHMAPEFITPEFDNSGILLKYDPSDISKIANMVEEKVVSFSFISGVYLPESNGKDLWYWSNGHVHMSVTNRLSTSKKCSINFGLKLAPGNSENQVTIRQNNNVLKVINVLPDVINSVELTIDISPGVTEFELFSSAKALKVGNDPRELVFSIDNITLSVIK